MLKNKAKKVICYSTKQSRVVLVSYLEMWLNTEIRFINDV